MKRIIKIIKTNNTNMRIINAILFGTGGAVISKGLLMLFNIVIARIVSTLDYGVYSIINNTVQTFTIFAGAGLGATLSRYVALYRGKNKKLAGILIKTLLYFNILISLIVALIMLIFANNISNMISKDVNISIYLRITSLTILFTSVGLTLQNILQGFEKFNKIALYQLISNIVMIVVGVILTIYFKIIGSILALLILNISMCSLFAIAIKKILIENTIKLKFKLNNTVKEAIKKVAIPAFLSSIFVIPVIWITNSIFTKYNGYEEFAAFSVCLQWFTILNYIPQQLGQVKPIYTQLYDEGKIIEFKKISLKMILISFGFSLCVSIILGIISPIILKMYGKFYINYKIPFIIILFASIMYAVQSQFSSIFYAIGKIWLSFVLNVVWTIIFIISFILLLKFGTMGYTLTYLISYTIYSAISVGCFYKTVKIGKKE